jgi:hypothetical protein
MKKFKTKTYDYKRDKNHVKLLFQWHRGGDVEVTLIVMAGKQKHLSGFFAIARTKKEAVAKLHEFCCRYYAGSAREVVRLLPWDDTIRRLEENERQRVADNQPELRS